ncbi:tubulin [Enterocytozoon bieneusi H348]|nr:tubulin [Enterocytozoon bieneusi H348]|eukprot:XP_002650062.1 tubulin [Enterocytozoon bieneusi H348]
MNSEPGVNIKNCIGKIESQVEKYTIEETKTKIINILEILKKRRSLLNLLFLKFCFIKLSKEDSIKILNDRDGWKILNRTFTSNNNDFINTLLEIYNLLDANKPISMECINRFNELNKPLFFEYLRKSAGLYALFEMYDDKLTYLEYFAKEILKQESIEDELNFVFKLQYDATFQDIMIDIRKYEKKFVNVNTYKKLFQILDRPEFDKGVEADTTVQIKDNNQNIIITETLQVPKDLSIPIEQNDVICNSTIKVPTVESNSTITISNEFKSKYEDIEKKYAELFKKYTDLDIAYKKIQTQLTEKPISSATKAEPNNLTTTTKIEPSTDSSKEIVKNESKSDNKSELPKSTPTPSKPTVAKKPAAAGGTKKFSFKKKEVAPPSKLETKQKYCGLKWTKVAKGKSSIFSDFDMVKLEEPFTLNDFKCFEIKAVEPKNTTAKTVKKEVPKGPVITSYLDGKKTLSLAIALGRIKLSDAELYNQIIERKFENETLIRQLLLYLATPEEFEQIKAHEDRATLARGDQFFYACDDLNQLEMALGDLRFMYLYKARDYYSIIKNVADMYMRILTSKELKKLFGVLLILGNQMNRGLIGGKAEGFTFDSLDKFKTKIIKEFLILRIDFDVIKKELGNLKLSEPVDALINEFMEVKGCYKKGVVDDEQYNLTISQFEALSKNQKDLIAYFNLESDEKLTDKLEKFINYFL